MRKSELKQSTGRPHHRGGCLSGFSLLEIVGVLAVIAVLAAAILPAWIKRIDIATRNREVTQLAGISNSLASHTLQSFTVPDQSTWQNGVANWSMVPSATVLTNSRRFPRFYYVQDRTGLPTLPFTQPPGGISQPDSFRAVMVSQLGGDAFDTAGGTLGTNDFSALWDAPDGNRPNPGKWDTWNGKGDDLVIQRVDYGPLFHRLVLSNRDADNLASFRIKDSAAVDSAAMYLLNSLHAPGSNAFYLHGTVVSLCDSNGQAMTPYVLTRDISFVFENGFWRGEILGANEDLNLADEFARNAEEFLKTEWRGDSKGGADQQTALTAMYSFMLTYTFWANLCPHFDAHDTPAAKKPPEYELLSAFGANYPSFLDSITGKLGMLNKP